MFWRSRKLVSGTCIDCVHELENQSLSNLCVSESNEIMPCAEAHVYSVCQHHCFRLADIQFSSFNNWKHTPVSLSVGWQILGADNPHFFVSTPVFNWQLLLCHLQTSVKDGIPSDSSSSISSLVDASSNAKGENDHESVGEQGVYHPPTSCYNYYYPG